MTWVLHLSWRSWSDENSQGGAKATLKGSLTNGLAACVGSSGEGRHSPHVVCAVCPHHKGKENTERQQEPQAYGGVVQAPFIWQDTGRRVGDKAQYTEQS